MTEQPPRLGGAIVVAMLIGTIAATMVGIDLWDGQPGGLAALAAGAWMLVQTAATITMIALYRNLLHDQAKRGNALIQIHKEIRQRLDRILRIHQTHDPEATQH